MNIKTQSLDIGYIYTCVEQSETPPRAVFLGNFQYMSLTDQRHWCKANGWFYAQHIPMCVSDDNAITGLIGLWRTVIQKTKLIVLGNHYIYDDIKPHIERNTKSREKKGQPPFSDGVPVVMESEIHKLHPNYPHLDNNSKWEFQI